MTWVKICGITNLEDALVAVDAGADAVGFVFYDKSPRRVSPDIAREIVARLPQSVEKVGVFVDSECDEIRKTVTASGLTAVQLHGDQSKQSVLNNVQPASECVGTGKLIAMIPGDSLKKNGFFIGNGMREKIFAILLDSTSHSLQGGTGKVFDWKETGNLARSLGLRIPVIVAGGLSPDNVVDAMRTFHPFGLDVTSGVEFSPGKKDHDKVRQFVRAVRELDRRLN
ncbi:MAG TPA: phosphoribosylanthranilate isomerase [Candidatus Sulfotelmatobacter sp.]|nr:phosphoribosylanthranilate isomerase [Candidatus Sulfotelmatobacter sp.]